MKNIASKKLFGLISLPVLLLSNIVSSPPMLAEEILPNKEIQIAQVFPNWSRVRLDNLVSVMFPGNWNYISRGIESTSNSTYYTAMHENLNNHISSNQGNMCNLINCKTALALAAKEVTQESGLVLKDLKPIPVTLAGYPIDAIEFHAKHPRQPMQMRGRMYIVGNQLYFLGAGTNESYFDNNVNIFLDSFSR